MIEEVMERSAEAMERIAVALEESTKINKKILRIMESNSDTPPAEEAEIEDLAGEETEAPKKGKGKKKVAKKKVTKKKKEEEIEYTEADVRKAAALLCNTDKKKGKTTAMKIIWKHAGEEAKIVDLDEEDYGKVIKDMNKAVEEYEA